MGERTEDIELGDLSATLAKLQATINSRAVELPEGSYTASLLQGPEDRALKKVVEEAGEVVMACKDHDHDHIRYEAADLLYHLLVVLKRYQVSPEELAGELDARAH
jgi:phosphoribosyl-ATP pyrophosphohydrolase